MKCKYEYRCGFKVNSECKYYDWKDTKGISNCRACNDNELLGGYKYNSIDVKIRNSNYKPINIIITAKDCPFSHPIKDFQDILNELSEENGIIHKFDNLKENKQWLFDEQGYMYKTLNFQDDMESLLNGEIKSISYSRDRDYLTISDIQKYSKKSRKFSVDYYEPELNNSIHFPECSFNGYHPIVGELEFLTGHEGKYESVLIDIQEIERVKVKIKWN